MAIFCSNNLGPWFGIGVLGDILDLAQVDDNNTYLWSCPNKGAYKVGADSNGNSVLTGKKGRFTAAEIEVFKITW